MVQEKSNDNFLTVGPCNYLDHLLVWDQVEMHRSKTRWFHEDVLGTQWQNVEGILLSGNDFPFAILVHCSWTNQELVHQNSGLSFFQMSNDSNLVLENLMPLWSPAFTELLAEVTVSPCINARCWIDKFSLVVQLVSHMQYRPRSLLVHFLNLHLPDEI